MNCSQIMTENPVCCLPTDAVSHAAHLMRQNDVKVLPVVSTWHSKKLIGILADRDLALRVVAEALNAERTTVAEIMTPVVMACREYDDVTSALAVMDQDRLRCIPILDPEDNVVGVVSKADLDRNSGRAPYFTRSVGKFSRAA
jgi:CBS domain-containing protein